MQKTFFFGGGGPSRGGMLGVSRRGASNEEYGLGAPLDTADELTLIAAVTTVSYAACKE